jgi:hypothetical protein
MPPLRQRRLPWADALPTLRFVSRRSRRHSSPNQEAISIDALSEVRAAMSTKAHVWLAARMCGLGLLTLLLVASCGDYTTDAATRLAYELEYESKALRRSGEATRTFTHTPKKSPEGVDGAYTVKFVLGQSGKRGIIVSGYSTTHQKPYGYGTSYHLNFVEVPKDLTISKLQGESVVILLTRIVDTVQVTALR